MLGDTKVVANVPVKDLDQAKKFYGDTLGLKLTKESVGGIVYGDGESNVFVYKTDQAGTNKATTASWKVSDVDSTAKELVGKGITMEHYDIPGVTREGDVHVMGELRAVWFKDPDGNILCVANGIG